MTLPPTPPAGAPAEPLVTVGLVTAVGAAILGLATSFGLHLTDAQTSAVTTGLAVVAPLVVALWGRRKVFSPATVRKMILERGRA